MRIVSTAAVIALLAGPAYAQMPNVNLLQDFQTKTPEEKEAEATKEKAYKESLKKIPDAKTSSDPWGNMRNADTPKSSTATSGPAKPRTRTGSSAN